MRNPGLGSGHSASPPQAPPAPPAPPASPPAAAPTRPLRLLERSASSVKVIDSCGVSHIDAGKAVSCHSHIACSTHFSSCRPVYSAVDLTSSRGRRSVVRARKVYAFALDTCSACCPTGVTHSGRDACADIDHGWSRVEQRGRHMSLCAISERVRNWSKRTLAVLELDLVFSILCPTWTRGRQMRSDE